MRVFVRACLWLLPISFMFGAMASVNAAGIERAYR